MAKKVIIFNALLNEEKYLRTRCPHKVTDFDFSLSKLENKNTLKFGDQTDGFLIDAFLNEEEKGVTKSNF